MNLTLAPITLRAANAFVEEHHRHHGHVRGHKFSIAVTDQHGQVRGVIIAGRPVARMLDDGHHLEVLRLATDGTPNVCSMLYAAVARAGVAMGYPRHQILTYILDTEDGTSLKAVGWVKVADTDGRSWHCQSRPRTDRHPTVDKTRWHAAPAPELEVAS